jgi:hypothetical protein
LSFREQGNIGAGFGKGENAFFVGICEPTGKNAQSRLPEFVEKPYFGDFLNS